LHPNGRRIGYDHTNDELVAAIAEVDSSKLEQLYAAFDMDAETLAKRKKSDPVLANTRPVNKGGFSGFHLWSHMVALGQDDNRFSPRKKLDGLDLAFAARWTSQSMIKRRQFAARASQGYDAQKDPVVVWKNALKQLASPDRPIDSSYLDLCLQIVTEHFKNRAASIKSAFGPYPDLKEVIERAEKQVKGVENMIHMYREDVSLNLDLYNPSKSAAYANGKWNDFLGPFFKEHIMAESEPLPLPVVPVDNEVPAASSLQQAMALTSLYQVPSTASILPPYSRLSPLPPFAPSAPTANAGSLQGALQSPSSANYSTISVPSGQSPWSSAPLPAGTPPPWTQPSLMTQQFQTQTASGGALRNSQTGSSVWKRFVGIPASADIIGPALAQPHTALKKCRCAGNHASWECPINYFRTLKEQCPGFNPDGSRVTTAWYGLDPTPATKAAWKAYIAKHNLVLAKNGPTAPPPF